MAGLLLAGRVLLAVVFAVAAISKLLDQRGSRLAMLGFGASPRLAAPLAALLPAVELAVAIALIPNATAAWGALGALMLLLSFVGAIGANLAAGRRPDCHCFGQIHSAPAGWGTLARNAFLAVIAGLVAWRAWAGDPGASPVAAVGSLSASQQIFLGASLLMLVTVAAQWSLLLNLLRQNGRLLTRLDALELRLGGGASPKGSAEGLRLGEAAPSFELPEVGGQTLSLQRLRDAGKPILLLFTDSDCGPCERLLPEIRRWQHDYGERLEIGLVSRGPIDQNRGFAAKHGVRNVAIQQDFEVMDAYQVMGTPSAVLVDPDGHIASGIAAGPDEVRGLAHRAAHGDWSTNGDDALRLETISWSPGGSSRDRP